MKKKLHLVCLLFVALITRGQTIDLYKVEIKMSNISPLASFMKNTSSGWPALLTNNWIAVKRNNPTACLGAYTDDVNSTVPRNLFNMSTFNEYYPFLDELDMSYYKAHGFDILKKDHPEVINDTSFTSLYERFKKYDKVSTKQKEAFLSNDKYRWLLLDTRINYTEPATFTLTQTQKTQYTFRLRGELKTKVEKIDAEIAGKIEGYLNKIVDNSVEVTGSFYIASYAPEYISWLYQKIQKIRRSDIKSEDDFVTNLDGFINSDKNRLITEVGLIYLDATYEKTKVDESKIIQDLKGKFSVPEDKAIKISSEIALTFESRKTLNFNSQFSGAFVISIRTDKSLDKLSYKEIQTFLFNAE